MDYVDSKKDPLAQDAKDVNIEHGSNVDSDGDLETQEINHKAIIRKV